jgi:hypothetical protein
MQQNSSYNLQKNVSKWQYLLTVMLLLLCLFNTEWADAKKKSGGDDKAVEKVLQPLSLEMDKLLLKLDGRYLFSPADAKKTVDLKYQLIDAMEQFPSNKLLARPVYQFSILLSKREQYEEAYTIAKIQLRQIKPLTSPAFQSEQDLLTSNTPAPTKPAGK